MAVKSLISSWICGLRFPLHRWRPRAVILLYHRIVDLPADPQLLSVKPNNFRKHLEHLRREYQVISLADIGSRLRAGSSLGRAVVLTFDDGYIDNLHNAKPLLAEYAVPATIFVSTGHMEFGREFLWDELEQILLLPGCLPRILSLQVGGQRYNWDLEGAAGYNEVEYRRCQSWNVLEPNCPTKRHELYRILCGILRPIASKERDRILSELAAWAGIQVVTRSEYRPLCPSEVVELADGDLIDIGAHTVWHPVLATLPLDAQRTEILYSQQKLEELLGDAVASFSYPFGRPDDYTEETIDLVREAGFEFACTTSPRSVRWNSNIYQLPRFVVRDWDQREFAQRLQVFFDVL